MLQPLEISEVLRAPHGPLVSDQVFDRQHGNGVPENIGLQARRPRLFECHAIDARKDVDAQGRNANLENYARSAEVGQGEIVQWCAEFDQGLDDAGGILRSGSHPEVEVAGRSHAAVRGQCLGTHHEVFNAVGVEYGQQLSEVWVHPATPSATRDRGESAPTPLPCAPPASWRLLPQTSSEGRRDGLRD